MKNHPILRLLILCAIGFYGSEAKAQRASEQPLSAFYSTAMEQKMNRKTPSLQPVNVFEKRASEKQLSAFSSKAMRSRLNDRGGGHSGPADTKRASQKSLLLFYSKAMKEKVNARANGTLSTPR